MSERVSFRILLVIVVYNYVFDAFDRLAPGADAFDWIHFTVMLFVAPLVLLGGWRFSRDS